MVRGVLPEGLVDDRGWKRLASRARTLPPEAADAMFGFECRLDHREASADLLLSVRPGGRFADALVRDRASRSRRGDPLARLLAGLRQPGSRLASVIDLVALEYDVAGVEHAPAPGVFLRSASERGYADPQAATASVAMAAGWNDDPGERNAVARVFGALPPGAAVRWAGAFPDRNGRAVRLLIRALGDGVARFLTHVGWPGDVTAVDRILTPLRACGLDNHVLALDVAAGRIAPGAGLELSRPGRTTGGWRQALDTMAGNGWCLPEKAAALGLATGSERIFSADGVCELHCGINHVKLTVSAGDRSDRAPGGAVAGAKGYVACVLRPLS